MVNPATTLLLVRLWPMADRPRLSEELPNIVRQTQEERRKRLERERKASVGRRGQAGYE